MGTLGGALTRAKVEGEWGEEFWDRHQVWSKED